MKNRLAWLLLFVSVTWVISGWKSPKASDSGFDTVTFGHLPVLVGGRVKPMDTVARNSLVILYGKQSLRLEDGKKMEAIDWLADVLFNPAVAHGHRVFAVHHPDVLGLFGWQQEDRKYFSYAELYPFFDKIDEQARIADNMEASQRTPFQTAIVNLRNSLSLYHEINRSLRPEDTTGFLKEMESRSPSNLPRYQSMADLSYLRVLPPADPGTALRGEWVSIGSHLLHTPANQPLHPLVLAYAKIGDAYATGNSAVFNQEVRTLLEWITPREPVISKRTSFEFDFNHIAPFYQCMALYVISFLMVCGFWLTNDRSFLSATFCLLVFTLLLHTFGLGARMYLQERPPVTNLYSSAVFIGWGTVIIGLLLERIFRDGIGSACASLIGFATLIIAHHLAGNGDTLEMLQAVLDTNFWLATHVVTITIGYSAMFLAGLLAILYVLRGIFTSTLSTDSAKALEKMTYGVVCFATLFSFVGTVLGGIWADQSWGRFWGWDPKENGALLIVLWCAITLHARWAGLIRQRGLMLMAIFGNVITSFSWFGVNMLGVGLHSYGFMDKAFPWLIGFILTQIGLILLASTLPQERWKSAPRLGRP